MSAPREKLYRPYALNLHWSDWTFLSHQVLDLVNHFYVQQFIKYLIFYVRALLWSMCSRQFILLCFAVTVQIIVISFDFILGTQQIKMDAELHKDKFGGCVNLLEECLIQRDTCIFNKFL